MADGSRTAAEFYDERDRRTRQMGVLNEAVARPVAITFGADLAGNRTAQVAVLALVNMLSRLHRRLRISAPESPLLGKGLVPATTLQGALVAAARAIDPFITVDVTSSDSEALSVQVADGPRWYLGAEGACGVLATSPQIFSVEDHAVLGGGMAACLAAAAACNSALGRPSAPARISAWDFMEGPDASGGKPLGHVELGSVLLVGAGAVASALAYWIRECDVSAAWMAIDRDDLLLHNTNRSLSTTAADAGWPNGTPLKKVEILSRMLGAEPRVCWYDEWVTANPEVRPDLVLPLANGRHVRRLVGRRFEPVLLHATTSTAWQAQLHRHVGGLDDCIECRMRAYDSADPVQLSCSTAVIPTSEESSSDAALPFLSGSAGLLLASTLWRMAAGQAPITRENHWSLHFDTTHRIADCARFECTDDCTNRLPSDVRQQIAAASRWAHLLLGRGYEIAP
jgi:hypothetical protein